jgi:DNA-nicking Smr family endonuclease
VIKKKELSQKDKQIWEEYIKDPSDIYDKDKNSSNYNQKRDRYKFDLHGFTLDEANNKVKEIIEHCIKNKFRELLLITGKGMHSTNHTDTYVSSELGKLKYSVPEFLKTNEDLNKFIISINDAEIKDGGEGAIIIKLKSL